MKKSKGNSFLALTLAFLFFAASLPKATVMDKSSTNANYKTFAKAGFFDASDETDDLHPLVAPNVSCNFFSLAGKTVFDPQGGTNIGAAVYINNDQPATFPTAQTAAPADATEWAWGTMEAYIDLGTSQQLGGVAIYKSWGSGTIQVRAATWNGTAFAEGAFIADFDLSTANNQWFINTLSTTVSTRYLKIVRSIADSKFTEIAICTSGGGCTDGIMNGNEQGIDCGGDCAACPTTPPSTSLSMTSASGLVPASLSLQINHPVYQFDASDFTVENGVVGDLIKTGLNYDVKVYPVEYGKNTKIYLASNSLINAIGLENAASNEIVITSYAPNETCYTVNQTENAALAGTATQSSTQQGATADRGNDNNTNGNFFANPSSVTYTNWEANPWWEVDLGKQATIHEVKVHNRTIDNYSHLDDYYIFISASPFGSQSLATILADNSVTRLQVQELAANPSTYSFSAVQGRYVRIQLNKTAFLTFAEIEVIADQ